MLDKALKQVYEGGYRDNWQGSLIQEESNKVHATVRVMFTSIEKILTNPSSTPEDRAWARARIDQFLI